MSISNATGSGARRMLPYGRQWISDQDVAAVTEALRSDWLTQGPLVEQFEQAVAERCGARFAVAIANGTAALHAACFAAGLGPGDEGIVPPISFAATANCLVYCGATPVFADVGRDLPTLDVDAAAAAITPRTRALLPVDYSGHPADLDELMTLARQLGLTVIEDAAHALGAIYKGRPVGAIADMTTLSFHPVKHITTGEGGMILTNREDLRDRLRLFRTHGITRNAALFEQPDEGPWYYEMQQLGYNYRLSDIQCALGISQLSRLDAFIARRRQIARLYGAGLADVGGIELLRERPEVESSFHLYPIWIDEASVGRSRREVFEDLRRHGIGVNVHYIPIHLQPYYRRHFGTGPGSFSHAERFYRGCISIPMYPQMNDEDVATVIEAVRTAVSR